MALVVASAVLAGATTASAGELPYSADIDAVCDAGTGDYDVTVTITSFLDTETAVDDGQFAFITGDSTIFSGTTTFTPNPVAAGGTTQATLSGPGDSVYVEVGFFIVEVDDSDTVSLELDGNCVATPTTPTSTVEPTSTVAAEDVVRPRFTG
jgi:hypothetical protein